MAERSESNGQRATSKAKAARIAELERELGACGDARQEALRERDAAHEREAAIAEILRVISASPTDLPRVLDAVVEKAGRLCSADYGTLQQLDNDSLRGVARFHPERNAFALDSLPITRGSVAGRAFLDQTVIHLRDALAAGPDAFPDSWAATERAQTRTILAVPLVQEARSVGVLIMVRREVEPFSERQIALLETFASQAVIAIENARLFEELQARNHELSEALEQQTATADILQVISRTPTDLPAVFQAICESAARRAASEHAGLLLLEGSMLRRVGDAGGLRRGSLRIGQASELGSRRTPARRAILECQTIHHFGGAESTTVEYPELLEEMRAAGNQSVVAVPLLKDGQAIGVLVVARASAEPCTPGQIALLEVFASQAVIAIENARLFQELEERNRDLMEALEQQTAIGEVLRIISSSPTDEVQVLRAIAAAAARLVRTDVLNIGRVQGDSYRGIVRLAGGEFTSPIFIAEGTALTRDGVIGRAILDRTPVAVFADTATLLQEFPAVQGAEYAGVQARLAVPLLKQDTPLGYFLAIRNERPFSESESSLLKTFADQAAIAIENARLFQELERRNRELGEALEQQTATAEVLRVISRSPADVEPVMEAIGDSAKRLCDADDVAVRYTDGRVVRIRDVRGWQVRPEPLQYEGSKTFAGRAMRERQTVHVVGPVSEWGAEYSDAARIFAQISPDSPVSAHLAVPFLREGEPVGCILARRAEARPYTDAQIALLQTFADQAVIAIENARLFEEIQAKSRELEDRNRELTEALEQQTATSEILRVIGRSSTDLQMVLDVIAESGGRLCDAPVCSIWRLQGDSLRLSATMKSTSPTPALSPGLEIGSVLPLSRESVVGRAIVDRQTIRFDRFDQPESVAEAEFPVTAANWKRLGTPAMISVAVPLLREETPLGAIVVIRTERRPFSEQQVALLQTFADQAVMAIENARLLDELKTRNRELSEALAQQTATADVLRIIANSPTELEQSLRAVLDTTTHLTGAQYGVIFYRTGRRGNTRAGYRVFHGVSDATKWEGPQEPQGARPNSIMTHAIQSEAPVQFSGTKDEFRRLYTSEIQLVQEEGPHAWLAVPVVHQGELAGALVLAREGAAAFTDQQVALVQIFADQSRVAIENARLFEEIQQKNREVEDRNRELAESLEQQTATSEILRVISSSPTDVQLVLDTIAEGAARLCEAPIAALFRAEGDVRRLAAIFDDAGAPLGDESPLDRNSVTGRAMTERRVIHIHDLEAEIETYPESQPAQARLGTHSYLAVPLLREGVAIGAVALRRTEVRPFTERQIELVKTFADQAVIAIENARLFEELQERTQELARSVEQLQALGEVGQAVGSSLDLREVLATILDHAVRLSDAGGGAVFEFDCAEGVFRLQWAVNVADSVAVATEAGLLRLGDGAVGRAAQLGAPVQIADITVADAYSGALQAALVASDVRSLLAVPMLREGEVLGALALSRTTAGEFAPEIVSLMQTLATQSVLAIHNARLYEELEGRNKELTESLEQQTATSEILRVISASPTDVQPVFDAIAESAARLCNAGGALIQRVDGNSIQIQAVGTSYTTVGHRRPLGEISRDTAGGRAFLDRLPASYYGTPEEIEADYPRSAEILRRQYGEGRIASLAVPLLREGASVGTIVVSRHIDVRPFGDKEIRLLQTFADQAVIAIENARLFEEIEQKSRQLETSNRELTESLDLQTAVSEVLRLIGSSPGDLEEVMRTLLERARRHIDAEIGTVVRILELSDETVLVRRYDQGITDTGMHSGIVRLRRSDPLSFIEQGLNERRPVQFSGTLQELLRRYPGTEPGAEKGQVPQTRLFVPLLREHELIGFFLFARLRIEPFSEQHVAFAQTFADQAVIAIENTRLFDEIQQKSRELEETNQQLGAASRAKSEFLSRMSHELRTPLNAIIGFAEIMEMDPKTTARQLERAHHILQGGRHLLALINEILDLTRIEAGRLSLSPEPVQLDGVVQEVLDLERPLAAEARVQLELENPDAFHVVVQADRQRLRQVILNLVANAVKYNRPNGRVTLSCEQDAAIGNRPPAIVDGERSSARPTREEFPAPDVPPIETLRPPADSRLPAAALVRLRVRDTGPGIPADQIGRLFAPFERLSAETSGVEGTGLGLAIARGLAEAMGGSVGVESVVGEGSSFWVELRGAVLASLELQGMGLAGGRVQDPAFEGSDTSEEARPTLTVLYIEDNQPNVDLVQHVLEFRPGVTLLTAPNGATGLRIARRYQPGLILLDLNLPDLQGDEVLARLQRDERTNAIPVVMVSADATQGQIDRLLAAGARAYLTKPLDVRQLLTIVDELATADEKG
jgi:GAF domain-containing protein/ActR/RegA family two-component response regulator